MVLHRLFELLKGSAERPNIESLPQDIWLIIVEKVAEDIWCPGVTLASLRLVNKKFHAAVREASFSLRPSKHLACHQQNELSRGCGQLSPSSLLLRTVHGAFPNLSGLHVRGSQLEGNCAFTLAMFPRLQTLRLRDCKEMKFLPEVIFSTSSLTSLTVSDCSSLRALPPAISCLSALKVLDLHAGYRRTNSPPEHVVMPLKDLPEELFSLPLEQLKLSGGWFRAVPEGISRLGSLRELSLCAFPMLTDLPAWLGGMTGLHSLSLWDMPGGTELPEGISRLSALLELGIGMMPSLVSLHEEISVLSGLQGLFISKIPALTTLPEWISSLHSLQWLCIRECASLTALPHEISGLSSLQSLSVYHCGSLASLSNGISGLSSLKSLHLWCPALESIPDGINAMSSLSSLQLWCDSLTYLPPGVFALPALKEVYLYCCRSFPTLLLFRAKIYLRRHGFLRCPANKGPGALQATWMAVKRSSCTAMSWGRGCWAAAELAGRD